MPGRVLTDQTGNEIIYPSGEMDLKRRVAGEVLRIFEELGELPADDELAELVEKVFSDIRTRNFHRIEEGRPIDVGAEIKRYFSGT